MQAYILSLATFGALNVMLALGLNLISGFCGQISLGHAAFYGMGAYVAALCAVAGLPFPVSLLAGAVAAGLLGSAVGFAALRVREDFLAITTMGVGFLFLGFVRKQAWLEAETLIRSKAYMIKISDAGRAVTFRNNLKGWKPWYALRNWDLWRE